MTHLTYCSNVHPGETWPDVARILREDVTAVQARCSGRATPFQVGLRMGSAAVEGLIQDANSDSLADLLRQQGLEVQTLNGFPFGTFHGEAIKEGVYAPDWSTPERERYTNQLADVLASVLPAGSPGSISTIPVTFKAWATDERIDVAVSRLLASAIHTQHLFDVTGADLAIALEPEPCCYLETVEDTLAFFEERLFAPQVVASFADATGLSHSVGEATLRRRLSVCYDVCHGAVEFETPSLALDRLAAAGVRIAKIQLSSALRVERINAGSRERIARLNESTYLHQVVARRGDRLVRFLDIPEALADRPTSVDEEWRIHFHVPIFRAELDGFASTQDALLDAIAAQNVHGYADHLEVETYTWGVLPPSERALDLPAAIARELAWAEERLI